MERLQKKMLVASIFFSIAAFCTMFYWAATKTIVIAEETADTAGRLPNISREPEKADQVLQFAQETQTGDLLIPLPQEVKADAITIENRYAEQVIVVALEGKYPEFYQENALKGNRSRIQNGFLGQQDGMTYLRLEMDGWYEHQYVFENGMLKLGFTAPKNIYDRIVVLDAACGGRDTGHTAADMQEKDVTLDLALRVKERLEAAGIRTYCTRTDDTNPAVGQRASFANQINADLCIGICLAADETNDMVYGIQTYYNPQYFIPDLGNTELADLLERETVTAVGGKANGLFAAGEKDALLQELQIPSAVIEVGFLTNERETALLASDEYRDSLADGIASAVRKAYAIKEEGKQ